jgi:predicted Zn-dependent peptidase
MPRESHHVHTFPNGLRLVHQRVSSTRLAHIGFVIRAGSRNDGSWPGMAHCFEHMMFKGTEKRKAIHVLNRLETVGGELNAFTTKELTSVYASVTTDHFNRAAELLTDVAFRSVFPEHELRKEQQVICEEINLYRDTPEENIYDEFHEQVFDGHPLAGNILGTPESVRGMKRKDLTAFRDQYYGPKNVVVSVVGNISLTRAIRTLEPLLAHIPVYQNGLRNTASINNYKASKHEKGTDHVQSYGILGNLAYPYSHPKRWALILLNNVLGGPGLNSRLNLAIREKYGFTYSVESGYSSYEDSGLFHCYVSSDKKNLNRAMSLIEKELKKLCENKLGIIQMHNAINQLKGQIVMADEHRNGLMLHLGKNVLQNGRVDTLEEVLAKIDGVRADDLLEIANEIFNFEQLSYLLYLPE